MVNVDKIFIVIDSGSSKALGTWLLISVRPRRQHQLTHLNEDAHIFTAILIHRHMNSPKRAPPNFLLDQVLVDAMLGNTIVLAVGILGAGIESFLYILISQGNCNPDTI